MKHIRDVDTDDIVQHPGGNKYKVLYATKYIVHLSESYDWNLAHYRPFTRHELEKDNWKVLTENGKTPMTKKELEELMPNVEII